MVVLLNIFLVECQKEQNLLWIEIFRNIINVFSVPFDHFNVSLGHSSLGWQYQAEFVNDACFFLLLIKCIAMHLKLV